MQEEWTDPSTSANSGYDFARIVQQAQLSANQDADNISNNTSSSALAISRKRVGPKKPSKEDILLSLKAELQQFETEVKQTRQLTEAQPSDVLLAPPSKQFIQKLAEEQQQKQPKKSTKSKEKRKMQMKDKDNTSKRVKS